MKNYQQYCEAVLPKGKIPTKSTKENRPYFTSSNGSDKIIIDDSILSMSEEEMTKKYGDIEWQGIVKVNINIINFDYKNLIKFIENNFNKIKMSIEINSQYNVIESSFEMDGKILGIRVILAKSYINTSWMGHKFAVSSGLSHIRIVLKPFMKYLTRDCKPQIEQFFKWMKDDMDMMIESEIMDSMKDYNVQKELYDMGYITLLKKVGYNPKLVAELSELQDIKKQDDWG